MILVDTCGWIEWLTGGALSDRFAPYMKDASDLLVPTTVQYELYKWVKRESDETTAHDTIALADSSLIVPLTTEIALMAADLTLLHKLAFADAVIYASARKHKVELIIRNECQISAFQLPMISKFSVSSVRSCGTYASSLAKNCRQASLNFSNVS